MPIPGASTTSALVVCIASLSGWCVWQENCIEERRPVSSALFDPTRSVMKIEDGSTGAPKVSEFAQVVEKVEARFSEIKELEATFSEIKVTQATRGSPPSNLTSLEAIRGPPTPNLALPMDIASSLDVHMHVAVAKELRVVPGLKGLLDLNEPFALGFTNSLSPIKGIVSSLEVKDEASMNFPLDVSRFEIVSHTNVVMEVPQAEMLDNGHGFSESCGADNSSQYQQLLAPHLASFADSESVNFFMSNFFVIAVVFDVFLAACSIMLCRQVRSRQGGTDNTPSQACERPVLVRWQGGKEMPPVLIKPAFAKVKAPLHHDAPEFPSGTFDSVENFHKDIKEPSKTSMKTYTRVLKTCIKARKTTTKTARKAAKTDAENHVGSSNSTLQAQMDVIERIGSPSNKPAKTDYSALQGQIDAIVSKQVVPRKQQVIVPCSTDDELKGQINSIVSGHAENRKQHEEYVFQVNTAMALAAAQERRQQSLIGVGPLVPCPAMLASPSPAKSLSNIELAHNAHIALSAARERNTPATSPPPPMFHWEACPEEEEVTPCHLNFLAEDDYSEVQTVDEKMSTASAKNRPVHSTDCVEWRTGNEKVEAAPFDVSQIPSPTKSRAKKQQSLKEVQEKCEAAWPSWQEVKRNDPVSSASEDMSKAQASKRRDFSSPVHGGAIYRMLQSSATPQKRMGTTQQVPRRSLPDGATHHEQEVAMRRAVALEAWSPCTEIADSTTDAFKFQ